MSPERWQQITQVFQAALACPTDERAAYLADVSAADPSLRREVEAMLAAHNDAGSFIEAPAMKDVAEMFVDAAPPTLTVGQMLSRYRVVRQIGAGGMGEVYLAEDTSLDRQIALKVLRAETAADRGRVRRFVQEAKAASALNHPNILTIYETGEGEGLRFMAAEYVKGETLTAALKREGLTLKQTLDIAAQIASALQAAHEAGIVHRDVKPDNVMLRPDGLVKVLDFGIAKLAERQSPAPDPEAATALRVETNPGVVVGTAAYMSPEQARGQVVDARSDIFSLGVVFYEMLTGARPFDGENSLDVIASILHREPAPLRQLLPDVPRDIERIVGKALRKDREERYQTAKDLLIDLKDVRQELEFQHKLEHAVAPQRAAVETETASATTASAMHTTSSAEYIAAGIKKHKRAVFVALALVVAAALGLGYWFYARRTPDSSRIESIAVLPFHNESGNADIEYLSDGMTESLINSLSQLPGMRVIARSSVFRYKGKEVDVQQAAKDLNVRAVLTGRVLQRGDTLDVSIDLTDAQNNTQLWGQRFTRKAADIFAVEDEIAEQATNALRLRLTGAQQERVVKRYTDDEEAYKLYLQGRFYFNKHTNEGARKAIDYFKQATARDPAYALAYAGLADTYDEIAGAPGAPPDEVYPQARAAVMQALAIDNNLAEAHEALGTIKFDYDWDWRGAESEYKAALALNPNNALAHDYYAMLLLDVGRFDEALAQIKQAQELDPLSIYLSKHLGTYYIFTHQYDRALEQLQKTLELDPNFQMTYYDTGFSYARKGQYPEALAQFQKMEQLEPENSSALSGQGYVYALWGKEAEARQKIKEIEALSARGYYVALDAAGIYAALDDRDHVFEWLEKGVQQHDNQMITLRVYPPLEPLHSDPRFQDLLRRVGLPQ
jgi:serine/threonine-protein kinase